MATQELGKKVLSPKDVREILKTDNKEIINLCKKASIFPKKNKSGQTFFSYDEVKNLQALKSNVANKGTALTTVEQNDAVQNLISSLENMENNLTNSLSKIIDEKLDGMDEVVVELIRCKTENETLRQKINELNKENYHLKNNIKCYKPIGLGFYIKKENEDFSL